MNETQSTCPYCGYALKRDPLCGDMKHSPLVPSPSKGLHNTGVLL